MSTQKTQRIPDTRRRMSHTGEHQSSGRLLTVERAVIQLWYQFLVRRENRANRRRKPAFFQTRAVKSVPSRGRKHTSTHSA